MVKIGPRKPSVKKRISARTTGRAKRMVKSSVNPLYGKKGMGYVNDPKKAVYNKVYKQTTFDALDFNGSSEIANLMPFVIIAFPLSLVGLFNASGWLWVLSLVFAIISGAMGLLLGLFLILFIAKHPIISLVVFVPLAIVAFFIFNLGSEVTNYTPLTPFVVIYIIGLITRFVLLHVSSKEQIDNLE